MHQLLYIIWNSLTWEMLLSVSSSKANLGILAAATLNKHRTLQPLDSIPIVFGLENLEFHKQHYKHKNQQRGTWQNIQELPCKNSYYFKVTEACN